MAMRGALRRAVMALFSLVARQMLCLCDGRSADRCDLITICGGVFRGAASGGSLSANGGAVRVSHIPDSVGRSADDDIGSSEWPHLLHPQRRSRRHRRAGYQSRCFALESRT